MIYPIYLTIYFMIHSLLASQVVKKAAAALFPERYYRISYNLSSLLLLIPVILMYRNAEKEMIFQTEIWTIIIGALMLIAGLIFLQKSMKGYDGGEFSGLKQLKETANETSKKIEREELSMQGLNAYVRHPLYFASLLIVWGFFVVIPNNYILISSVITTLYLFPGIYLEEQKLIEEFGQSYREYQKAVPMLLPSPGIIRELWKG